MGTAADKTAQNNIDKYARLATTHIFYPFVIETAGTWHDTDIELTQKIDRHITTITEDGATMVIHHQGNNILVPTPVHFMALRGEIRSPSRTP